MVELSFQLGYKMGTSWDCPSKCVCHFFPFIGMPEMPYLTFSNMQPRRKEKSRSISGSGSITWNNFIIKKYVYRSTRTSCHNRIKNSPKKMGQGTSRHTMREVLWEEKNLAEVQY